MRLIVGLGNPGNKYKDTLHNIGFTAIDTLAEKLSLTTWTEKFKGELASGTYGGEKVLLLKPLTYMNLSGQSVQACVSFYKIPLKDVLVISDDVDLPPGKLRFRSSGGHGGHNGLRNIIELCGNGNFNRLRIGVGRSPNKNISTADYVLAKPNRETQEILAQSVDEATGYLQDFLVGKPIQIPK